MKTNILPWFLKLLGGLLVTFALIILLLAYVHTVQSLIASVGWHDIASVGWVG